MKFEYEQRDNQQWYWRLKADNHEVIACGEGYKEKEDCLHAIRLVRSSGDAEVVAIEEVGT